MPASVAHASRLRAAELVDHALGRLLLRPLSAKRVVRQAIRVFKAHRTVRFDGRVAYPELLIIEVAPAIVDACPEMFDRDGCRAIAEAIADGLEELDSQRPTIAVAFERNRGVEKGRGFRIGRDAGRKSTPGTESGPAELRPMPGERGSTPTVMRHGHVERAPHAGHEIEILDALWRLLDNGGAVDSVVGLPGLGRDALDASRATRDALMGAHPLSTARSPADLRRALEVARRAASQLRDRSRRAPETG